jgi:hypothetical protein
MTIKQKIAFLDRLFALAKQEYSSKKESTEKDTQMDIILSKLNSL